MRRYFIFLLLISAEIALAASPECYAIKHYGRGYDRVDLTPNTVDSSLLESIVPTTGGDVLVKVNFVDQEYGIITISHSNSVLLRSQHAWTNIHRSFDVSLNGRLITPGLVSFIVACQFN